MTWHDKSLPSSSFWQIFKLVSPSLAMAMKTFESAVSLKNVSWCFTHISSGFTTSHYDFTPFSLCDTSTTKLFSALLIISRAQISWPFSDPFCLIKASMVEITLPSSRLRNCAEAGRSMAEETSTKERHCLGGGWGRWVETTHTFGWVWLKDFER